ncbi:MAG TPA: hypothetical protein VK538_11720 [Solirubrobacteraceae bacterium]|jgi:hypothetical protein|nr:hypothetical protein [Solirubrobacteraceae bacterium]
MDVAVQVQRNPVADEVSALVAVVRPILAGLLFGLKADVADEVGGKESVKLKMMPRMVRPGDGDLGICFEYAVHNAMLTGDGDVLERVDTALSRLCGVSGAQLGSILFAVEKSGSQSLINTNADLITTQSVLMSGVRGQPVKLGRHIGGISRAFRSREARERLPTSIAGVWKADLFLGKTDSDRWVGTSVRSNRLMLEGAHGLRIGIVPASETGTDAPYKDEGKNLAVCPLPYEGAFMETFYKGWELVQIFLAADAQLPAPNALPRAPARQVARMLAERREAPVVELIDTLAAVAQPELLYTEDERANVVLQRGDQMVMDIVIAPEARKT